MTTQTSNPLSASPAGTATGEWGGIQKSKYMKLEELQEFIGREGTISVLLSLTIPVKVINARQQFGRNDVLITPLHGAGQKWIELNGVTFTKEVV